MNVRISLVFIEDCFTLCILLISLLLATIRYRNKLLSTGINSDGVINCVYMQENAVSVTIAFLHIDIYGGIYAVFVVDI